jgi:threonine/homoserine/homoserine lactone efflux protein
VTEPLTFLLAVLALLATPGPTNTLLATSGASAGFGRSWYLIFAEMIGYAISVTTLALIVGPVVRTSHELSVALRIVCALFLFYSAWKLWREGAAALTSDKPVSFRRVLVATMLNPKGIVFAFVIVPHLHLGELTAAMPYMGALMAAIALIGGAWIAGGAVLRAGARASFSPAFARRAGAVVLCVFAALITGSTFTA